MLAATLDNLADDPLRPVNLGMCPTSRRVTNLNAPDRAASETLFQALSPRRPDMRAHVCVAPRADARTPLPHHADAMVASDVGRGRIHAVPVARRGALHRVGRVGVDAHNQSGRRSPLRGWSRSRRTPWVTIPPRSVSRASARRSRRCSAAFSPAALRPRTRCSCSPGSMASSTESSPTTTRRRFPRWRSRQPRRRH